MINFIGWIILGGLAGWIASKIMGRDAQMGVFLNIVVGIIGSFIGGWVLGLFGVGTPDGFNIASFLTALLGAVILLFLVGLVTKKR
ncbi:GlsB/YeaQ/YmgE family stress response membrane protein [Corynebacterium hindlerae]|uniref:GlsB/YeaQ/YmgE family stress response membrane protein n=1 Tax=Corynebacterium hindlerae TaxID=699041 RepID=A0A7G5FBX6_9CORY|nr:GlsB/YeaQ/YmgE family stress response membrane protein [Corynebacterium hindlerae]QMV84117.1 GlsB/YeaQ/YmgE family stress response membrane protein [Corynebacterium hindlerae]QTH60007.1 GlsB/YeaQ/YmgE family stress response membrane protein [Corynebacterium hindlerae]